MNYRELTDRVRNFMGDRKGTKNYIKIIEEDEMTKEEILKDLKLPLRIVESRANDLKRYN